MATPNVGILTNSGKALIDQVNAGQTQITFSKIVFSSMDNSQLTDDQIKALTAITPQEIVVNNPEVTLDKNTGETRIRATGNNEALTDGVYVKTYAVYAKDDSGNEILYGLTISPNPNYLPEYDGVTPQAVTYSYKVNISNTSNITFTNSNDIYVSDTDLAGALQPYAKTVDVNQQLDKKVNVADMRKPASDVAGIEEVNAKQDKIGYTPADDSKVVHSTVTELNSTDMNTVLTAGFYRLASGTNGMPNTDEWALYQVINLNDTNGVQLAYGTNNNISGMRSWHTVWTSGNAVITFSNWVRVADNSKVVHSTDMRKPASDVAGIEEVNAKQDKIGYTPADDSKVAHLSGDEEIGGQKTFDVAPIDKTTGNPYITKDGVPSIPSDVARTSQQTNFTAGLQKGGIDVATAADLKSVEKSAWHTVTLPDSQGLKSITMIYKIHDDEKYIEANIYAYSVITNIYACIMLDLSGIVHSITDIDLAFTSIIGNAFLYDNPSGTAEARAVGAKISLPSNCEIYGQTTNIGTISEKGGSFAKIYYDSLVNN
ncbi:pyocin knob domain-containing protein [Lentilactobacillus buchneri]|uniref:pyocin knob domain-containing protein n=1 Tax=Lentilactobacillus buchneri TaxID=1581 RepID=UPI002952F763|nr:pyocin knob domain-containing protein [Lentilactobacillus buchneri]BEJ53939.1 hypothetical protein Ltb232_21150 [Lentilactobacillus buchneri subsp. silagei]